MRGNFLTFKKQIGENIKRERVMAGLTQEDMEEGNGLEVRYIRRIEKGHNITLRTLYRLADKIGVPVRYFF